MVTKFVRRVIGFLLPVIIVLIALQIIMGSFETFSHIDRNKKQILAYWDETNTVYAKHNHILNHERYKVWTLGSSRSLQFREFFFREPGSFFNLGYTVKGINGFREYLSQIPSEKYPEVLVINLDQWIFNPKWYRSAEDTFNAPAGFLYPYLEGGYYHFIFKNAPKLKYLHKDHSEYFELSGVRARANLSGSREDGSRLYGSNIYLRYKNRSEELVDHNFAQTYSYIEEDMHGFEWSDEYAADAMDRLRQLVVFCKEHNIQLYAFFPPYAPSVYEKMHSSGNYNYIPKASTRIAAMFDSNAYVFKDFSYIPEFDDSYYVDGYHAGEQVYAHISLSLLPKALLDSTLERRLDMPGTSHLIMEEEEHEQVIKYLDKIKVDKIN